MGCTASRSVTTVAKDPENHSPSLTSSSSFSSFSAISHPSNSNSSPPGPRTLSLPMSLVHHPPTKKGDTHHLVSLTSTTYGSLLLLSEQKDSNFNTHECPIEPKSPPQVTKTTQNRVNQTEHLEHSLSPDSVINTWELMDGLEDDDDDGSEKNAISEFDGSAKKLLDPFEPEKKFSETASLGKKPLWQHLSEEALLAKLGPSVAWSYQRALSSRKLGSKNLGRGVKSMGSSPLSCSSFSHKLCSLPGTEDRIVVYFTSLRGIRKTYADCCSVRMILKGFRVPIDEKDISMDSNYRKELQNALGGKAVTLPQVFIRGNYVGNAEEIKQLNESGELGNLLKGFPIQDPGLVCEGCGDARFVPCPNCNGSRKVYEEEDGELRRCPDCNENGLIRCPSCCS